MAFGFERGVPEIVERAGVGPRAALAGIREVAGHAD
jgi:hypothetical protein